MTYPGLAPLRISNSQVSELLSIADSIKLAREAYLRLAKNEVIAPERVILTVPDGASVFTMLAHRLGSKTVSVKVARLNPSNSDRHFPSVTATLYLYDAVTGQELAQIEAEALTELRTAASTAVATDLLAPADCETLGILGTGRQARAHVPALLRVRNFSRLLAYSRSDSHRKAFAADISDAFKVPVVPAGSPKEVVKSSDVLVLATNSPVPLFDGRTARPGTHVNAIGAALPTTREVDTYLVRNSFLAVDSASQASSTYGDILIPLREHALTESEIHELGDLLADPERIPGTREKTTLFKSGGLAALDAEFGDYLFSMERPDTRRLHTRLPQYPSAGKRE